MTLMPSTGLRPAALAGAALVLALAACTTRPPPSEAFRYSIPAMPEGPSGYAEKPGFAASRFAVAAANPLATDAGYQVLKAGGSALDAAIAVQMVLTLVEPQSSGIGGGAFLLHWDGARLRAWDGRETAPAAVDEKLFLLPDGKPMPFIDAVVGGRSVGVPGTVKMLEQAHREHGKLAWARLFEPAIALAEQGFHVSPRLHTLLKSDAHLKKDAAAAAFYYRADGEPHPVGHVLRNPALADVLRGVASRGSAALYSGPVAVDMVARVRNHPTNPGRLSESDLSGYTPKAREAICTDWKAVYRVCGFPPPSSGHIAVMQILGILDRTQPVAQPMVEGVPSADVAARLHRGRAPGLRRPRHVPGRSGFRCTTRRRLEKPAR